MNSRNRPKPSVIVHKNRQYALASPARRWWARIIDTTIVLVVTILVAMLGYIGEPLPSDAMGTALVAGLMGYVIATVVLGLLYGWGAGLGQMMTGVKSRRTSDGRRVGGFRGMMRYLAIAFLPSTIYLALDAPALWIDNVVVFRRKGEPLAPGTPPLVGQGGLHHARDPQHDARFTGPDPYQNGPRHQPPTG